MRTTVTLLLSALMLTASLAIADQVRTDHDRSAGFYRYRTFMWANEPQTPSSFMNEQIMNAISLELQARGMCLVPDHADLAVSVSTAPICNKKSEFFYAGLPGGWSWSYYWTPLPSTTVVEPFELDTLVVYLFETETNRPVWWGTATEAEKSIDHLNRDVERMFEYFPPA